MKVFCTADDDVTGVTGDGATSADDGDTTARTIGGLYSAVCFHNTITQNDAKHCLLNTTSQKVPLVLTS